MASRRLGQRAAYHAYSVWLFTASDIKTIIAPSLMFALFTAPASSVFGLPQAHRPYGLAQGIATVLFWLWANLFPFNIDNQSHPESIAEDAINKPWRTLPSKRMTPAQARVLMRIFYPIAVAVSLRIGGLEQCLSLVALGFWYNNLGGADSSCLVRNLINAAGFNRFTTGALDVLLGGRQHFAPTRTLLTWQAIVAGIVFTTVQTQDMYDQEGDAERGRRTVPLVLGDANSRWLTAGCMTMWCVLCPSYIGNAYLGYVLSISVGGLVAVRTLLVRSVEADKTTFKLWNFWLVVIYTLPLLKTYNL